MDAVTAAIGSVIGLLYFFFIVFFIINTNIKEERDKIRSFRIRNRELFLKNTNETISFIKKENPQLFKNLKIEYSANITEYGKLINGKPLLKLKITSINDSQNKLNDDDNIITGDENFDIKKIVNSNNYKKALSLLSYITRLQILTFLQNGLYIKINDNEITAESINYNAFDDKFFNFILKFSNSFFNNNVDDLNIIDNIKTEKNKYVRINNLKLLIKNKNNDYSSFYKSLLNDDMHEIRIIAANQLKEYGISTLINTLNHPELKIQLMSLDCLKNYINNNNVFKSFINLINKTNEKLIILKILDSFIEKKHTDCINKIHKFIKLRINFIEDSKIITIKIIRLLGLFKDKKGIDFIIKHLNNKDKEIVMESINSLIKINSIKTIPNLNNITKGFIPAVIKKAAKEAIQKIQASIPEDQKGDLTLTEIEKAGELSPENNKE